jgi:hypothetical protein
MMNGKGHVLNIESLIDFEDLNKVVPTVKKGGT